MKIHFYLSIFLLSIVIITGCDDIIEKNVDREKVTLVVPANASTLSNFSVNFIWEPVKGASLYKLQVSRPSFTAIQELVLDTNVSGTKFTTTLKPGNYEWRVRAFNSTSVSAYSTYSFKVDSTSSLQSQTVLLLSPANNRISNQLSQQFHWSTISIADYYRFEIFINGSRVYSNPDVFKDTLTYKFGIDGTYVWKVRAENGYSVTPYSSNTIIIDTKAPNTPVLVSPVAGAPVKKNFTLKWSRGNNTGSAIYDSVYIYSDSLNTLLIKSIATTDSMYNNINADTTNYVQSRAYFWKVKSIDASGNKSSFSTLGKFRIQ